jgi:hypothetical protein
VYISDTNRFVSNIENIDDVYLEGDDIVTEIDITNIEQKEGVYTYETNDYYLLVFEIEFNTVRYENTKMQFKNANLVINYSNSKSCSLPIGNVNIYFVDELHSSPFDIKKMKGLFSDDDLFSGVVIKFDKLVNNPVTILSINFMMSSVHADIRKIRELTEDDESLDKIMALDNEFSSFSLNECPYEINDNSILFIPISKDDNNIQFNRFPVIIHYIYLGKESEFVMDDFLFYSINTMNLEVFQDELIITHYYVGSCK